MSSKKEGAVPLASPAWIKEALRLAWLQGHKAVALAAAATAGGLAAHLGVSQTNSHLGRGHKVGFLHFQSHLVSSHIGVQTALGATQEVRH